MYQAILPTTVLHLPKGKGTLTRIAKKLHERATRRLFRWQVSRSLASLSPDVVYVNSAAVSLFIDTIPLGQVPLVVRVPELDTWIRHRIGVAAFERLASRAAAFIAVSKSVRDNLISSYGIDAARIHVIPGFLPAEAETDVMTNEQRNQLRQELGIPSDAFVVGGAGTLDWRKGPDLFIQIAAELRRLRPEVKLTFAWQGGGSSQTLAELRHDANRAGVSEIVSFLGVRPDALRVMEAFDVFAMTSREDPYPLVVLEAASRKKPIVCFANAGGAPEFVASDCGYTVPYLDIGAFAKALSSLIDAPEKREEFGLAARRMAVDHHTVEILGPKVMEILQSVREHG